MESSPFAPVYHKERKKESSCLFFINRLQLGGSVMQLYIPVNYKNKKRYKLAKYPIRQPLIIAWLIHLISRIGLMGQDYKIEKVNMEGLKGGYFLLSNHMYFIDFLICAVATGWRRVNNVVSFDGYYRRPWLMELIGSIGTRKYTMDLHLI